MIEMTTNPIVEALHFPVIAGSDQPGWLRELDPDGTVQNTRMQNPGPSEFEIDRTASESDGAGREKVNEIAAARMQGIEEGREAERQAYQALLQAIEKKRAEQAARMIENVAIERERYMHAVEREVVKLALAIAALILRRESQMDPLFLTGAVRVALAEIAENSRVRLRVPAEDAALWAETMLHLPNLKVRPAIEPDQQLQTGDCVIETDVGSANLGFRAQLEQVERSLLEEGEMLQNPRIPSELKVGA